MTESSRGSISLTPSSMETTSVPLNTRSHSFSAGSRVVVQPKGLKQRSMSFIDRLYFTRRSKHKSDMQEDKQEENIIIESPKPSLNEDERFIGSHSAPGSILHTQQPQTGTPTPRGLSDGAITGGIFLKQERRRRRRVIRRKYISHYRPRKIVVVGDMHSGKSCLVSSYCSDKFIDMYSPTILKCMPADCKIQGRQVDIIVADTPGRYDYLPLRKIAYDKCDLVIICFALDSPQTLENVEKFWIPEVLSQAPGIPFMVVGNRRDCRDEVYANWCSCEICQHCHLGCQKGLNTLRRMDADELLKCTMLSFDQGYSLAKDSGAVAYQECSAKFRDNTRTVFECATKMALKKHRRKRKHKTRGPEACVIL